MPLAELPALARRAEALGYTDAWSMEINSFDAFTPLAAVAAASGLRVGTAIVPVYYRPLGLLAMHASALAALAPGRFVLGIGTSTPALVEQWMGVPFQRPLETMRETATGVATLLAGERYAGRRLGQAPAEKVPVYLAALSPNLLRLAGEVGEGVVFFLAGPRAIPGLLEQVGREVDSVARLLVFSGEGREPAAAARRWLAQYALVPYYARSLERQGFGEEVVAIAARSKEGDREGAAGQVSEEMLRELALLGDADRVREGVRRYREAGLKTPVLLLSPTGPDAAARRGRVDALLEELASA